MPTTTAFVFIGEGHPNDVGINATHVAELWEGDQAVWVLRSLAKSGSSAIESRPQAPELLVDDLIGLIGRAVLPNSEGDPTQHRLGVAVVTFAGSTLNPLLHRFVSLESWDVTIFRASYSRTWDQWTGWNTSGEPPGST